MKVFIHFIQDDKFTNEDTGEVIEFANAYIYDDEHFNTEHVKGRRIIKVKISKGLIKKIDGAALPGYFDAELGIASAGKMKLVDLKPLSKDQK